MNTLYNTLASDGPFRDSECATSSEEVASFMSNEANVLVVGAGGLGCEIVKNLALNGFRKITIIDMDTIDLSNLNRQFLFTDKDVGQAKSTVAAKVINERLCHLGVQVTPLVGKIQDYDASFYGSFYLIICGLDNIGARRWINSMVHGLVQRDEDGNVIPSSIKILLDGGTEGLRGQARVIIPTMTSCFECTLDSFPPQVNFPLCTIAETPRLPEHCVEYSLLILWPKLHEAGCEPDFDNPNDIEWLHSQAAERASFFGIEGVTYELTLGVVKRIVPAVASTNAIVAGILVVEAVKIASYCNPVMNNFFMYMGNKGIYCHTFEMEKNQNCLVCSGAEVMLERDSESTLEELIKHLVVSQDFRLHAPSITCVDGTVVYMQHPEIIRKEHEFKLTMTLCQLIDAGFLPSMKLIVTDAVLTSQLVLNIKIRSF